MVHEPLHEEGVVHDLAAYYSPATARETVVSYNLCPWCTQCDAILRVPGTHPD